MVFRRSGKEASVTFDNKDEALIHAQEMVSNMNDEYCQKHSFNVVEDGNTFQIMMGANR